MKLIKGKYGWWLISTHGPERFILHLSGNKKGVI